MTNDKAPIKKKCQMSNDKAQMNKFLFDIWILAFEIDG
jgi:hypothetical protein